MRASFVFVLALVLSLLLFFIMSMLAEDEAEKYSQQSTIKKEHINILTRQLYRWYIASTQDEAIIIKNLHSNYALGYLMALRDIATDDEILQATGLDIRKVSKEIAKQQDNSLVIFVKTCPDLVPDDETYRDYVRKFLGNSA